MARDLKLKRRQLLQLAGGSFAAGYTSPLIWGHDMARASGGSGGGSGGSGGSGGASRGDGSDYSPRRRNRQASQPSRPQAQRRRPAPPPPELVVWSTSDLGARLEAAGYRILQRQSLSGAELYRLGLPRDLSLDAARDRLARDFPEATHDDNALYRPEEFLCADGSCAAQSMVGWPATFSRLNPRIGLIDTGVNPDHEALRGQALTLWQSDLGEREAAGRRHGTAIAALLIGHPESRTPGLLPQAELIAVEAFHRQSGGEAADAFSLAGALERLREAGVSVINLSFAGPENAVLHRVVQAAHAAGVVLVAAAGNGGPGARPAYPAAWPEVIAVTAVDSRSRAYRQANHGDYIDFAAPGVNLWTAASVSGGRLRSGTSFAAPFVTAAVGAMRAADPSLSHAQITEEIARCAQDLGAEGRDPIFGAGLISLSDQCGEGNSSEFFIAEE